MSEDAPAKKTGLQPERGQRAANTPYIEDAVTYFEIRELRVQWKQHLGHHFVLSRQTYTCTSIPTFTDRWTATPSAVRKLIIVQEKLI